MRRFLIAVLLLTAAAVKGEPLRLIAPADGDVLRGGHFASLAWNGERLGHDAEEWEAFLSVDGGRFYSVRLTPHLGIAIHRFDVLVPNVDSDDVRILIRTGNERNETIINLPERLHIRAEATAVRPSQTQAEGPESARPNEPRVVQWSVGDHVESTATPDGLRTTKSLPARSTEIISVSPHLAAGFNPPEKFKSTRPLLAARRSPQSIDVLFRSCRMNV